MENSDKLESDDKKYLEAIHTFKWVGGGLWKMSKRYVPWMGGLAVGAVHHWWDNLAATLKCLFGGRG